MKHVSLYISNESLPSFILAVSCDSATVLCV